MPGSGQRMIGFQLVFGSSHVHVVNYRDRSILKDGYHGCLGLRRWASIVCRASWKRRAAPPTCIRAARPCQPRRCDGLAPPDGHGLPRSEPSMTVEQQTRKTVRIWPKSALSISEPLARSFSSELSNINNSLCNFPHISVGPLAQDFRPSAGFQQAKRQRKSRAKALLRILIRTLVPRTYVVLRILTVAVKPLYASG